MPRRHCFHTVLSQPLAFTVLFPLFSYIRCTLRDQHSIVICSSHFDKLWIWINCYPLWKGERASLMKIESNTIYRSNYKYLEDNLILCSFSKAILVASPLGPIIILVMGSWPSFRRHEFPIAEKASNPRRKQLVDPIITMPLLYSMGISCQAGLTEPFVWWLAGSLYKVFSLG